MWIVDWRKSSPSEGVIEEWWGLGRRKEEKKTLGKEGKKKP